MRYHTISYLIDDHYPAMSKLKGRKNKTSFSQPLNQSNLIPFCLMSKFRPLRVVCQSPINEKHKSNRNCTAI